ncbi:MAG TPA: hypothetical protein VFI29_18575, partial [Hanamia sp.]|nr:hypothetical protein [Hanamia sp.]
SLQKEMIQKNQSNDFLEKKLVQTETKSQGLQDSVVQYEKLIGKKEFDIHSLNHKVEDLTRKNSALENDKTKYESAEEQRAENYNHKISQLNQLKETLEREIKRLSDERMEEQKQSFERMKRQWSEHEITVEQALKMICQNHLIKYLDEVPFRGNPDNVIEICDEYIIFDAKCPANDDLTNFPKYIKAQAEAVKKYANQDRVKRDIFLVIPSNTIHTIKQLAYNMGDYHVYIITKDSLEPIILALKKIEDYEFVNQLSPEERDNICRVIGRFAHTTKRKIQIDQFFATEFLDLLVKCKNDLPDDILKQVIEFENAEKLNPPSERKSKQILTSDLQEKHEFINAEAGIRKVVIPLNFEEMKNLV